MGLTEQGLAARILKHDFTLTTQEAIDLFYMFPDNIIIKWENKEMKEVNVKNLGIKFKVTLR